MSNSFTLFDKELTISQGRELDIQLILSVRRIAENAKAQFEKEYANLGGMDNLMKKGDTIGVAILNNAADECVNILVKCEVYDVTAQTLIKESGSSVFLQAFGQLADWYESILEDEAAKDAYRTARRQNRSKFVGGGFGVGGAIKGAATAGALNMATGAVHGTANLIGKGFSTAGAAITKSAKYNDDETRNTLSMSIYYDVVLWTPILVECIECESGLDLEDITFDDQKTATNLFKTLSERDLSKEQQYEVAFRLLETDPTEAPYYKYCVRRYPEQAVNIARLARYLSLDIGDALEDYLKGISNRWSHESEEDVIALRKELEKRRQELGLTSSRTIQSVDEELRQFDIQARTYKGYEYETREEKKTAEKDDEKLKSICGDIETLDREKCMNLYSTLPGQDYTYNILTEYMVRLEERITAIDTQRLDSICGVIEECSEERCMELQGALKQEECFPGVKEGFLERIKNRIESIWSAEDGQIFDNILLTTDFTNPDSVNENIEYIETSGRTENKKKYIAAIRAFNNENIKIARDYYALSQKTFLQKYWIQIAIIAIGIILGFVLTGELSNLPLPICIAGGVWLAKSHGKERKMRDLWNTMTIDGTVIHSCLKE